MNKKCVIKVLEAQKYHIEFRGGDIIGQPSRLNIVVKFVFNEKVGRERLLREIIICSPMKKADQTRVVKEFKTIFGVPILKWDMSIL